MAPRANWKGFLKVAELTCPVALYTAASTSERIAFHTLNRATGHRVRRQFVDQETGKPVESDEQVKGYEVGEGEYVVLEPDEIAAAVPESDKTLAVAAFIRCDDIDAIYFDRPYYLSPSNRIAEEAFALIREGLRAKKAAALARTVLFRRVQTLLIRPHGEGLIATTLNFDYEVRSAHEAFHDVAAMKIKGEMLELAEHIISTKRGKFDPSQFDDRYEAALADLVRAKLEGKPLPIRKAPAPTKVVDLMEALRQSAGAGGTGKRRTSRQRQSGKVAGCQEDRRHASKSRRKASNRHHLLHAGGRPADPLMALETYRRKRDFKTTAEPRGKKVAARKGDSYVIQKHAARRLHYDLRLEMDGVLKSWAVTRGPSLVPGEKRLAVHVEDHPLEYGDFEGTIPKGEYGGGTVIVWDRGRWKPIGDPHKGYAKGHLEFELDRREAARPLASCPHRRQAARETRELAADQRRRRGRPYGGCCRHPRGAAGIGEDRPCGG